jgi:hypothetical protein
MTTETTPQLNPVKQIESLYARLEKARTIFAGGKVHRILGLEDHYAVESSKGDGFYQVNGICTCMDAQNRTELHHGWCCHKLAVEIFKDQQAIADTPQVAKAAKKPALSNVQGATTAPPESDRTLEDQLADLYPKARPTYLPR